MTLSEAIEAVGEMLSGYANREKLPHSYVGTIAALLCSFPRSVAVQCADPLRGLVRTCKFIPTVADVVAWCEPRIQSMQRVVDYDERTTAQLCERAVFEKDQTPHADPVPKWCRANVFVVPEAPQYEAMVERSKTASTRDFHIQPDRAGIWVPLGWLEDAKAGPSQRFRRLTTEEIYAMYPPAKPETAA